MTKVDVWGIARRGLLAVWTGWPVVVTGCQSPGAITADPVQVHEPFVQPLPQTDEYVSLLKPPRSAGMRSGLVVLAPGADCGWHSTEDFEEVVLCLEGAGELRSEGGAPRALVARQLAYNPPQSRHCIFNTGSQTMRYVYVVAPVQRAPQ